ncbi:MAG: DUF6288 domain-containing protein, partial [Phycisphaerae bacterium]|nr:DUF6288 domain-containing protein [Phycisphaerae bacterium]
MACLALMAQGTGNTETMAAVRKYLDKRIQSSINDARWNWGLAFSGIAMAEYQIMTGDEKYRDYMLAINDQFKRNGTRFKNYTYGHVGLAEGNLGYGSMKGSTNLVLLSWAMMEKAGLPIHAEAMEKTLVEMDMAGCDGYGWSKTADPVGGFDAAVVVSRFGDLHSNIEDLWFVARTAGFPHGNSALLHRIRPWQSYSPTYVTYLTNRMARCRNVMVTGHGSGMLHGWSTFMALCMASNRGVTEPLRLTLDYNKRLLNSARCYDGGFYTQQQRDAHGGDLRNGSRTTATALWLTVLSAPDKKLRLMGAMDDPGAPTVFAGVETMTWSGGDVQLEPVVVEEAGSEWTELTYTWRAEPSDGVVFTPNDGGDGSTSSVKNPIVTITKDTDDPSVVTLTLAVNNQGRAGTPVEDSMSVYVYDDACQMVRIGQGKATDNPTDLDGNCITDLADFAELAAEWLGGEALPAAIQKR